MQIVNRRLTREEFSAYINKKFFGYLPANKLVVHHTWKPTVKTWNGQATIYGLKRFYEGKGWPNGPHLFIAEDGIWLFTDMRKDGIHAGSLNPRSIGIEVVGNYDYKLWDGETKKNALWAISELQRRLKIPYNKIYFHRDVSAKTCPGKKITKSWLFNELENLNSLEETMNDKSIKRNKEIRDAIAKELNENWGDKTSSKERNKALDFIKKGSDVKTENQAKQIKVLEGKLSLCKIENANLKQGRESIWANIKKLFNK